MNRNINKSTNGHADKKKDVFFFKANLSKLVIIVSILLFSQRTWGEKQDSNPTKLFNILEFQNTSTEKELLLRNVDPTISKVLKFAKCSVGFPTCLFFARARFMIIKKVHELTVSQIMACLAFTETHAFNAAKKSKFNSILKRNCVSK